MRDSVQGACYRRAMEQHDKRIATDLAFGDAVGPALLVGEVPAAVARGAMASATGIALAGSIVAEGGGPSDAAFLDDGVPWVEIVEDVDALDDFEEPFGSVVLWGVPDPVLDWIEAALRAAADGAVIHLVQPVSDRGVAKRWVRLIEASCEAGVEHHDFAPEEPFAILTGRRRRLDAPVREVVAEEALPMAIIAIVEGRGDGTERVLLDVLLRQTHPAAALFVVDMGGARGPAPEDLYGFATSPPPTVALVPADGLSMAEAVNDVLGAVDQPFVGFVAPDDCLAANHHATLGMLLERSGADLAVCDGLGARGMMVRLEALRAAEGLNPDASDPLADLRTRVGNPVRSDIPVASRLPSVG